MPEKRSTPRKAAAANSAHARRNATGACVAPSDVALGSGAYPLSLRVALLARPDSALNTNVTEAEAKLRIALSGAVPVEAAVAGR